LDHDDENEDGTPTFRIVELPPTPPSYPLSLPQAKPAEWEELALGLAFAVHNQPEQVNGASQGIPGVGGGVSTTPELEGAVDPSYAAYGAAKEKGWLEKCGAKHVASVGGGWESEVYAAMQVEYERLR
jgi:hypothetical protein